MSAHQHSNSDCDKAYNQGCLWGLSGRSQVDCPYQNTLLREWWESGWQEGNEAWRARQEKHAS